MTTSAAPVPTQSQRSAIDRLRDLPALVRGGDLTVRFQWDSKQASHYLWLWKKRGFIEPLGGHSDVYANLLVQPRPNWEAALLMARPSATIIGVECLRRAGWTTQIPHAPEVAIDRSLGGVFGGSAGAGVRFQLELRSNTWFQRVRQGRGIVSGDSAVEPAARTAPSLKPAWALADMLARDGWDACGLSPDDIDWDLVAERDRLDWARATDVFRLDPSAAPELEAVQPSQTEVERERY